MNEQVLTISRAVRDAGGRAMLVGGCVRDQLFGLPAKDFDLEVYYLEPAPLYRILKSIGQVNTVGEHFAVYKLALSTRFEIDVSIPRRESKAGQGHRGFVITGDPFMSFAEAARRRDFTINAILQDPLTGDLVDPYGGIADLQNHILRVVAAETFVEDSLRVLRAVQLAARFAMTIDAEAINLCRSIALSDLPHERIWGEIEKLLLLAPRPSVGLQAALELGVLEKLFPQLCSLLDEQVEVDAVAAAGHADTLTAFELTKRRLDEAVALTTDLPKEKRLAVLLAAWCLHSAAAVDDFLDRLGLYTIAGYDVRDQVRKLVLAHKLPGEFFARREHTSDGDFRRLAQRVDMTLLYRLAKADRLSRGGHATAEEWFDERTRLLGVEEGAPAPLLLGRHLLAMGIQPGKQMGDILRNVYEQQLDGAVTSLDEAKRAAEKLFPTTPPASSD